MEKELPKGWVEVTLEELLVSLESGSRPKGGVRGIADGVPSIGGEHLKYDGGFEFKNIKYVPKSFANSMSKGQIKVGDILIVKDGATTGKTSFVTNEFPFKDAVVNEHVFICRASEEISSRYLFWYLYSEEGSKRVLENFKGSAQGGINKTFAENTSLPVAPFAEQQRIVAKLDTILARANNCKRRLDKVGKIEEKMFFGYVFKDGELYKGVRLEKFCVEGTERIGRLWSSRRLIGVSKDEGIVDLRTGGKKTFENYKIVKPRDFIYNPMRVDIGSIAIYEGIEDAITSPDYVVFRTKDAISAHLLLKFLKSSYGLEEINNNTQGSVRSRLYFRNLIKINFPYSDPIAQEQAEKTFTFFRSAT